MRPCIHRYEIEDCVRFVCTSPSLVHDGTVAPSICEICPFPVAPQTLTLLSAPASEIPSTPTQFVWFWVSVPDGGEELKHSMRSVLKHFQGEVKTTVIGDKPSWYTGHHIPCPRIPRNRKERSDTHPFRDTQSKIVVAANHSEIDDQFIWIMDDVYLIRPTTLDDLMQPRFDPWYRENRRREWHRCISATFTALKQRGYPALQFGTHLPIPFEKEKLLQMFVEFDFPKRMLLFEILYGNRFKEGHIPHPPFLHRLQRPQTVDQLNKAAEVSNVLNYVSSCWRTTMRLWIQSRFPDRASHEA